MPEAGHTYLPIDLMFNKLKMMKTTEVYFKTTQICFFSYYHLILVFLNLFHDCKYSLYSQTDPNSRNLPGAKHPYQIVITSTSSNRTNLQVFSDQW